jgi:hypothetical protein
MPFVKKYSAASLVLVLAGLVGVFLMDKPIAEYVRNPYYRDALELEKEFPFIDVIGFSENDNEISMGLIFLDNFEGDEGNRFTRWLNYVVYRRAKSQTKSFYVWVISIVRGRMVANGLWVVDGDSLQSEGVTNDTLKPSQIVYFRWIYGEPFVFEEGVWPWAGR